MISLSVCLPDWQQCQFISDCVVARECFSCDRWWWWWLAGSLSTIVAKCCRPIECVYFMRVFSLFSHTFSPFFHWFAALLPFIFLLFFLFFFTTACQWACFVAAAAIIVWFASNLTELTTQLLISLALFEAVLVQLLLLLPLYNAEKFFSPIIRLVYWFVMFVLCR